MLRYFSSYFLVISCLCHFVCCGIPFFLGLTAFTAYLGLSSLFLFDLTWFESIEKPLFIFTTVLIFLFVGTEINSRKLDCYNNENNEVCSQPCESQKKLVRYNLYISLTIYCINFFIFFMEQIIE